MAPIVRGDASHPDEAMRDTRVRPVASGLRGYADFVFGGVAGKERVEARSEQ